ncbi:MAG: PAS domain-containing protein [Chloroflexi bacterium]|nr:PAS domain-containing protein [Chloroflexota bacterium]
MQLFPYAIQTIILAGSAITIFLLVMHIRGIKNSPGSYRSVFNALKDGVLVLDDRDIVVNVNLAAASLFQDAGQLIGRDIISLFPKWDEWQRDNPPDEFVQEISKETAGNPLTLSLHVTSLFDSRGRRNGRALFIRDVTGQKLAQEQIAEDSRMKSQLLASLGHDLRSPLGAIIGYAEMLKDGSFGSMSNAQVNAASEILDGATQLLAFMNNLIGQIQLETGKIVLQEYPFEVEEVIGPLLSTMNFHALKKGLILEQTFDPNLPSRLIGDQFWLRQIVMNLVHNSVKFTRNGYVRVSFAKRSEEQWMIQVADTGIGIPIDAQKRVFEAFEQVQNVETAKQIGSGLGLSIVAGLTSSMKGIIELQSEEGKGTTFSVILPLKAPVVQGIHQT